ncbi:gem-associated protein 8-like [Acomys russatus]|uniref:gem-associated protein 8-like n=1 Tax=Acomys russatus TaxID=60746 RepID=UPI0021E3232A|nr:gem-associated protein 8-like [Acomys russatus]
MASRWRASESWYSHPAYAKYWRHYFHAMAWMHSYQNAYRKFRASCFSSPWFSPHAVLPWSSHVYEAGHPSAFQAQQHVAWQEPPYTSLYFQGSRQPLDALGGTQEATREGGELCGGEKQESESDDEVECDLSNMEITDELRQYFAETERHREERRRQQRLDEEHLGGYVNADHDLYYSCHQSVEPPSEKPGARRQAEMKHLYGDSAPKILAMEASIQLNFDKKYDRKKPKYWPVIPLKF